MSSAVLSIRVDQSKGIPTPGTHECGLAWTGYSFWHYDSGTKLLYEILPTGNVARTIPFADGGCDTEFDGTNLWQAAPNSLKISQLNPNTGAVIHSLNTLDKCSGLCTDGYHWYRGSWDRAEVIRFDPASGAELESMPTGATTSGLTSDGRYLWHAGSIDGADHLFCLDPEQGKLIFQQAVELSICGLTYDGRRLWAACNRRHQIIPIEIS